MRNKGPIPYNPFFFFPFLIWVVAGGILLSRFSARDLFFTINSNYSPRTDVAMYYITMMGEGFFIIGALLLTFLHPRLRNWWYFLTALLCNIIPFFIQQLIKSYYDSPRPVNFFKHAAWIHLSPDWPVILYRSYPSGHSEGAFCFFCFLSLLLAPRYRILGLVFFILALLVAYSRVYLAAHFFADVYTGSIIGVAACIIIYFFMGKFKDRFLKKKDTFI